MYAFLDDSGDPGTKFGKGSSDYLVVAACIFSSAESMATTSKRIDLFFAELGWHQTQEFKFSKTHKLIRKEFLRLIASEDFFVRALAIDKRKFAAPGSAQTNEDLLRFAVSHLLQSSSHVLEQTNFRIDGNAPKKVRDTYRKMLSETFSDSPATLKKLRFIDSKSDRLIQLADAVAGAVRKGVEQNQTSEKEYLRVLAPILGRVESTVDQLP